MRLMRLAAAFAAAALLLPALAGPSSAAEGSRTTSIRPRAASAAVRAADGLHYQVSLDSYEWWFTGTTFTVVGDVRNDTDVPVKNVRVHASASAADDSVVANGSDLIMFAILDPGGYGSFRIDAPLTGTIDTANVWVEDWDYTSLPANHYFTASGTQTVVDAGTTRVQGSIRNLNTVDARDLRVVATLYDPADSVVGAAALDLIGTLSAGASTTFTIDVEHLALSYTPTVRVDVEADSDPELLVTFNVDPSTLTYGRMTTVTGRTTPGADVRIQYWDQPDGTWANVRGDIVTAGTDGSYELTLLPAIGSTYRASSGDLASVPVVIYVQDKVTLKSSTKKTTVGKKVVLSGTANPADDGSKALIQRRVGAAWKTIATVAIAADGRFRYTWTPKAKGTYVLRAYVGEQSLVFAGTSGSVTIVVK